MKLTYVAHVVEIALIVFLLLYIFVLAPTQSPQSSSLSLSNGSSSKPPDLRKQINSTKDVLDDLTSLGCNLIALNASEGESKLESMLTVANYSDFRRVAYNTKLVFYAEIPSEGTGFFTVYQSIAVGFPLSESSQTGNATQIQTGKTGKAIQIQSIARSGNDVVVYVQNVGDSTINLVNGQCLYINGALNAGTAVPTTLAQGATATITSVGMIFLHGDTVTIKVTTADGTYSQIIKQLP